MRVLQLLIFHTLFYISMAGTFMFLCLFLFLPRSFMQNLSRKCGVVWVFLLSNFAKIDYEVTGWENIPKGPCIFASKHQSMWETQQLYNLLPRTVVVTKKELFYVPFFGVSMKKAGFIFVERKNSASALKKLIKMSQKRIKENHSIIIFPEGTRRAVGAPPDYKVGVGALYKYLGVPCVPIALNSGLFWPRRSFRRNAGTIEVKILPPIEPGLPRDAFMKELEDRIENKMKEIT